MLENHTAPAFPSRRDQIETRIAEALHEMLNSGMSWREVTVEKIAAAAGIKRTLFYVYYPDRAAVLIRLGEQLVDSTVTAISTHFLVQTDGINGIREELLRFIEMMRVYRPVTKALMEGSGVDESVEKFWRGLVSTFVEPTAKWIEDLQKNAGASPSVDPAMTAFCLVIMTGRVALHPLAEDPDAKDDLFEAVVGIWTNALYSS